MAYNSKIGVAVEVRNPTLVPGQETLAAFSEIKGREETTEISNMSILWEEIVSSETLFSKTVSRIKTRLSTYLPEYMIPSAYISIQSLPFLNSYKLDRRTVKERANFITSSEMQKILSDEEPGHDSRPLTEREVVLRSLWAEILHVAPDTIGIHQDFFYSGGDSLKAMALVSAARRRSISCSLAQLYQLRTIAQFSQLVGEETY